MEKQKLPDTELKVMQAVWHIRPPCQHLCRPRGAAKRNVLEFIRFADPFWADWCAVAFCRRKSRAKSRYYTPLVTEEDYLAEDSRRYFQKWTGGSLRDLVACLYVNHSVTKEDLEELKAFIEDETEGVSCYAYFSGIFEGLLLMLPIILPALWLLPRLSKRYAARVSYVIWLVLAVRLLIPWNLTLPQETAPIHVAISEEQANEWVQAKFNPVQAPPKAEGTAGCGTKAETAPSRTLAALCRLALRSGWQACCFFALRTVVSVFSDESPAPPLGEGALCRSKGVFSLKRQAKRSRGSWFALCWKVLWRSVYSAQLSICPMSTTPRRSWK